MAVQLQAALGAHAPERLHEQLLVAPLRGHEHDAAGQVEGQQDVEVVARQDRLDRDLEVVEQLGRALVHRRPRAGEPRGHRRHDLADVARQGVQQRVERVVVGGRECLQVAVDVGAVALRQRAGDGAQVFVVHGTQVKGPVQGAPSCPRWAFSRTIDGMPSPATLAVFAAATAVLLLLPGPSVLFIVARTLEHGRRGGLVSMLGVETGALLHVLAATAGLSALVTASPGALLAVKLAGAGYLLVLGVRALRGAAGHAEAARSSGRRLFRQGLVVDALNPKTAMFFLAFLPQFIDPAAGSVAGQTLVLGLCFVALATLSDGAYALLAGFAAARLRRGTRLERASGAAYIGLGALTALSPA